MVAHLAFKRGEPGLLEPLADVFDEHVLVVVRDWESVGEDLVDALLQELLVRIRLDFDQIREGEITADLGEIDTAVHANRIRLTRGILVIGVGDEVVFLWHFILLVFSR